MPGRGLPAARPMNRPSVIATTEVRNNIPLLGATSPAPAGESDSSAEDRAGVQESDADPEGVAAPPAAAVLASCFPSALLRQPRRFC